MIDYRHLEICSSGSPITEIPCHICGVFKKEKNMLEKFWMVVRESENRFDNRLPNVKHPNLDEAITEASRLCVKENKTFYVLEAVKAVKIVNPETEVVEL